MQRHLLLIITLFLAASTYAAKVDTLSVKSTSMNKDVQVVVITPDAASGKKGTACPVIYLLHSFQSY